MTDNQRTRVDKSPESANLPHCNVVLVQTAVSECRRSKTLGTENREVVTLCSSRATFATASKCKAYELQSIQSGPKK